MTLNASTMNKKYTAQVWLQRRKSSSFQLFPIVSVKNTIYYKSNKENFSSMFYGKPGQTSVTSFSFFNSQIPTGVGVKQTSKPEVKSTVIPRGLYPYNSRPLSPAGCVKPSNTSETPAILLSAGGCAGLPQKIDRLEIKQIK